MLVFVGKYLFLFVGLVSDLAPGQMGMDDMKMLEQKAQQLAAEAEKDKPKPKEKILFVRFVLFLRLTISSVFQIRNKWRKRMCLYRSDASRSELAELAKQANPDEINIDDDEDDDNEQGPDGE